MNAWMIWAAVAGIVVILELFTGTFYLLMISLGMVAGALVALAGASSSAQLVIAGFIGSLATVLLHRSQYGWKGNADATKDPNVNMDIGQLIDVNQWSDAGNGRFESRVSYRGAMWDVELHYGPSEPGRYEIMEVRGSKFIVRQSMA